jgi:hypothetical protein
MKSKKEAKILEEEAKKEYQERVTKKFLRLWFEVETTHLFSSFYIFNSTRKRSR